MFTTYDTNDYIGTSTELDLAGVLAVFLGLFLALTVVFVIVYIITAILLYGIFKQAGYKTPAAAWVPIWNTAALFQVGGIQKAWLWILVLFGGSFVAGLIPYIGSIISLVLSVFSLIILFFVLRNIQRAFNIGGTGNVGAVLGIFFTFFFIIWLFVASRNKEFNLNTLRNESEAFPFNWFGNEEVSNVFK